MRISKARESLQAAEICLEQDLCNSVANRVYYAMFQAAIVALTSAGLGRREWSHGAVQSTFALQLTRRRKLYPRALARHLVDALALRIIADYGEADVSKRQAQRAVRWAQEFVGKVEEVTGS